MLAHYKRTPTQKVTRGFSYLFMALCVCVALLPIIWVILSSFKTNSEIFSNGLSLPSHFGFDGYVQALEIAPILKFFANSLIVATITTILNVFCLAMAGYVFAKKRFRFKNTIFAILSLSMVIPTTLMSPVYNIITKLGLYDTKIALILVYTALNMPISLMVLRSAFASIPTELEEAARMDGCNDLQIFCRIILPLSKPVLASVTLFYAVTHWNSYFNAMMYISDSNKEVIQIVLRRIIFLTSAVANDSGFDWGAMGIPPQKAVKMATTVVATVPILLIYPFVQKYFTQGVMVGSVKG